MIKTKAHTISEYMASFPAATQVLLKQLYATIAKAAPEAEEKISYGIPTFTLNGNLVHFGAYTKHIGFYPAPSGINAFKKELSKYPLSKGAIQFPLNKPLPLGLVTKIVKFRVRENSEKLKTKNKS